MYEIMMRHSQAPVPKVKTPVGSPPAAIRRGIAKAMSKDPADRFETAGEFAEALRMSRASVDAQAISGNRVWTGIVVAGAFLALATAAVLLLIGN